MTTETETMRESFEWTALNGLNWNKRDLERNKAGEYEHEDARAMWLTFQAGYATAKAETAAAVTKERELCASIADRHARIGVLRSLEATYKANAAKEIADAIRAGAKEPSDG